MSNCHNCEESKKSVICLSCGWVHFQVSRKYAEEEVKRFNEYFDSLGPEKQQEYYGGTGSSVAQYEHCNHCNDSYKNFRDARSEEMPYGSTIGPIISREE